MDAVSAPPSPVIDDIIVRLADEGVPIRVIARATTVASSDLYDTLRDALQGGKILELPKDDWPIGTTRQGRNVLAGTPLEQEGAMRAACARVFKASPLEAGMLALMLRRNEVTKEQLHTIIEQNRGDKDPTDPKMVDVMICKLRKKLLLHDIKIETMWGTGYLIDATGRRAAIVLLSADVLAGTVGSA
jgi:DNA-binding response OmpR family regulator